MKFLIDSNILIPLEPASKSDLEVNTELALSFINFCNESGNSIFVHPAIAVDIEKDKDEGRKALRKILVKRYNCLQSTPSPSVLDETVVKPAPEGSNDWVDNNLLAALQGDLVDYLVSEDNGIHKKAKLLSLGDRVLRLADAVELLKDFFDSSPPPHPTVEECFVYNLNQKDPIFVSLREDYSGFDEWLKKCSKEHRKAFIVKTPSNELAGLLIWKKENLLPNDQPGKVLKICTFKVSELHGGNKLGELLFKPLFEYIELNKYEYTYLTTFPKQTLLIDFANDFGFFQIENKHSPKEIALCKSLIHSDEDIETLSPLDFHIKFGPRKASFNQNKVLVVPIRPEYFGTLFPDLAHSPKALFPAQSKPCGNAIKKAYICNAQVKKISPGDVLFFYRSSDFSAFICFGVVEDTLRSRDAAEIARFVGKRTVYTYREIEGLCNSKCAIAILFRMVKVIEPRISLPTLIKNGILKAPPQSIMELKQSAIQWIRHQINM